MNIGDICGPFEQILLKACCRCMEHERPQVTTRGNVQGCWHPESSSPEASKTLRTSR